MFLKRKRSPRIIKQRIQLVKTVRLSTHNDILEEKTMFFFNIQKRKPHYVVHYVLPKDVFTLPENSKKYQNHGFI